MTRFYDNTITTNFIKYLLSKFELPMIPFFEDGMFVKKDNLYICNNAIYKCNGSGNKSIDQFLNGFLPDNKTRCSTYIQPFVLGEHYTNITTNFIGKTNFYDPETHYHLGEFLRSVKAVDGIDLMPLYNCFNGEYIDGIYFEKPTSTEKTDNSKLEDFGITRTSVDSGYKILSVPIKFGREYTIAIDSDCGIETIPVIYSQTGIIEDRTMKLISVNTNQNEGLSAYHKFDRCSFQDRNVVIDALTYTDGESGGSSTGGESEFLGQYEKFLRLLIKVPSSNKSSVVVFEGNCANIIDTNTRNINIHKSLVPASNDPDDENVIEVPQNIAGMITTPKINFFNDGNIYAFSDTLIQYLLLGVICGVDPIDENIIRVQECISSEAFRKSNGKAYTLPYRRGVWDENIQSFILNTILNSRYLVTKLDKNGLVDRETEGIITRGQVV